MALEWALIDKMRVGGNLDVGLEMCRRANVMRHVTKVSTLPLIMGSFPSKELLSHVP